MPATRRRKGEARPYRMRARAEAVEAMKARILDSAYALMTTGSYEELTLDKVAADADTTVQTVLRHFKNKDGLITGVAEQLGGREFERRDPRPGDARDIARILCARYEEIADANLQWELLEDRVEALGRAIAQARELHRSWLERMFADVLQPLDAPSRARVIAELFAATDINTWRLWRRRLKLSQHQTRRVMTELIEAVLVAHD